MNTLWATIQQQLWHADLFEETHEQIILSKDDAWRLITGFGMFISENIKNSKQVLRQAIPPHGKRKQILTDYVTQYKSLPRETCIEP